jgi:hypothetical protein
MVVVLQTGLFLQVTHMTSQTGLFDQCVGQEANWTSTLVEPPLFDWSPG